MDLRSLTYLELQNLKNGLEAEFKTRKTKTLAEARAEIQATVKKYGLTLEEILSGKQTASPASTAPRTVAPKYRNPQNTEQTWTGRGKKPIWVNEALFHGKKLEDLSI